VLPEFDDSSFADFLKEIMMPASPDTLARGPQGAANTKDYSARDVLAFGFDTSLDLNDVDIGLINSYNERLPVMDLNVAEEENDLALERGQATPNLHSGIDLGIEAFKKSLWRWTPAQQDRGYAEQVNLALPYKDMSTLESRPTTDVLDHRLEQNSRDGILAMLLSTCEPANIPRVASSFPSAELLDNLLQLFSSSQLSQSDFWIHLPTFRPHGQRPEFNGIVVAAGAVLSSIPTIRKLGYAIQEAVRLALPKIVRMQKFDILNSF
jgi:hypothetical protein